MQLNDDLLYIPLEENEFALFETAEILNLSDDTNELLLVTVPYQSSNTKLINSNSTSEPASNKNTEYADVTGNNYCVDQSSIIPHESPFETAMTIENQVSIDSSIHEQESSSCNEIISETKNAEAFINFNEQGLVL
ncbi:hypothetical protein JTB14_029092 [Gonioctena quinquepunctata]|nr:hypothetical protein JTB14_029092 [Gonioctena quinquepunctata]